MTFFKSITLLVLTILIVISCSRKTFPTKFYDSFTPRPQELVDSILRADTLELSRDYKNEWNRSMYITSDSVITTQYVGLWARKDTTYIISITEEEGDSIVYLKYRKE